MLGIQLKVVKGVVEKGVTVVLQLAHISYMCVLSVTYWCILVQGNATNITLF